MIASNDKELKAWRKAIADAVLLQRLATGKFWFAGAVKVKVRFFLSRKTKKDQSEKYPVRPYDLDKLCRSVGDALSIDCDLILNDSQIVNWDVSKRFGEPRAEITVTELLSK